MKTNTKLSIIAFMALSIAVSSCKKDKKELPKVDENELITTIKLKFTNDKDANDVQFFTWKDIDGKGGKDPVIDDIKLIANTTYKMEVNKVLNETSTPVEDITEEIVEENYEHLLVYKPSPTNLLSVLITDEDKNKFPVGLMANIGTGNARNGTLQIILRHQPGVKDGTEAPGNTDFDITYKVTIQ